MKKYEARKGAPFKKEKAQVFGERIDKIMKSKNGCVHPIDLIKDGEKESSPFHDYFEWDDSKAGHAYRLHQARSALNHIVECVKIEGVFENARSFISVNRGTDNVKYVALVDALTIKDYRTETLNQLIVTLENATRLMKLFKSYDIK